MRNRLVYDKRFWRMRSFSFEHSEFEIIDPDDVDVSRHIIDEKVDDSKQMHQLITTLMTKKFESDCPPWAIHRISNQVGSIVPSNLICSNVLLFHRQDRMHCFSVYITFSVTDSLRLTYSPSSSPPRI